MNGRTKIALAMLIWGSVGIFARFSGLSGLGVAFMRVALGSLVLWAISINPGRIRRLKITFAENWKAMTALGTALAFNWVFLFTAFNYTLIATAVLVYYLAPIIATLISWWFLGEKISRNRLLLIGMAFGGFLFIASGQEFNLNSRDFIGVLLALVAAFFYALIPNFGRFLKDVDGKDLTLLQLSMATLFLLPFVAVNGLKEPTWWAIGALVLLHTVFALYLYMDGLKEVEVNEAALMSYLDPLSAIVYAFIIFGEVPGVQTILGGTLILLASALDAIGKARGS
ncbi:DMT family transporter [Thermococcus sp.]